MKSVLSKQSLYYFDSSDDEEEDKLINAKYTPKKILDTLAKVQPYLSASYVLTEISQSILEQQTIQGKYAELKNFLSNKINAPKNIGCYHKANKFLGKFLIEDGSVTAIDLDKEAEIFVNQPWMAGEKAQIFHKNRILSKEYVDKLFQENLLESKEQLFGSEAKSNQIKLQNKCLTVSAELLQLSKASVRSNNNIYKFTQEIIKNYNNRSLLLSDILETLQLEEKAVNFQNLRMN